MASRRSQAAGAAAAAASDFVSFKELQTKPEMIRVGDIEFDEAYQQRIKVRSDLIAEYAQLWLDGVDLGSKEPMIIARLTDQGGRLVVIDCWHRAKGLAQAFGPDHERMFEVANITAEQALVASFGANPTHGYMRTNEDKRKITDEALKAYPNRSDEQIARWCAVSGPFVGNRRKALEAANELEKTDVRISLNGKVIPTGAIGAKKKTDLEAPAVTVTVKPTPATEPEPKTRTEPQPDPRTIAPNGKFTPADGGTEAKPEYNPAVEKTFVPASLTGGGFQLVELSNNTTIMLLDGATFSVSKDGEQIDLPAYQVYMYLKAYADKLTQ